MREREKDATHSYIERKIQKETEAIYIEMQMRERVILEREKDTRH